MLPKPFLFIKELFFRELARRGGSLTREAALRLVPLSTEGVGEDGVGRLEAIYDFYLGSDGDSTDSDDASSSDDNAEAEAEVEASLQGMQGKMKMDSPVMFKVEDLDAGEEADIIHVDAV